MCFLSSVPVTLWVFYRGLLRRLAESGNEVTAVCSAGPELSYLGDLPGVTAVELEFPRKITPFRDLISLCKLWRFLRRHRFDILHAHTPKASLVGIIAAFLAGVPNRVYTVHGSLLDTASGPKYWLLWMVEWVTCKLATRILAVSPSLMEDVVAWGFCPREKIQVLAHGSACGVDLTRFSPGAELAEAGRKIRARHNISSDALVIGYVGRIVPDKGIKVLVEAFEELRKEMDDSYLLLVGEFEDVRDVLDNRTLEIIRSDEHIIADGQWIDDVRPFYAAMDISVLPTKREGFGVTMIESSAMKLPVVATRTTGCMDSVADGVSGLLVDVDNPQQFREAVLRLVKDPGLREKLGRQGRRRVEECFDTELLIDAHIELYQSLAVPR